MKKLLALLLSVLMVFSLTACSGTTETEEPTTTDETEEVSFEGQTITVGIWGGNDQESAGMDALKAGFEELTGATVEYKTYTDYNTQLQADFIGNTAPDAFYLNADVFDFYSGLGVLEPLDKEAVNADAFYDNLTGAFTDAEGTLYGLPKDFSSLALYVNEDLLTEAGYTLADVPSSLEEMITFLPELQASLDAIYGEGQVIAMSYNQDLARNLHLLERDGGSIADADGNATLSDAAVVENLDFMLDLIETGAYKTPADVGTGWNGEMFGSEKVVLMEEGNWVYGWLNASFPDVNFTVTDMPEYKGERSSMFYTVGYAVSAASDNKALATEWIKYATGVEGMKTWAETAGVLPSRQDVADAMNLDANPDMVAHMNQVEYALANAKGTTYTTINDAYKNFLPKAIDGTYSAAEAMKMADDQANEQIALAQ